MTATHTPGTAVEKAPQARTAPQRAVFETDSLAADLWTSFQAAEREKIITLMQRQGQPLSEQIGKAIEVEHLLAHRVESVDRETGEVLQLDRIVLVSPDGAVWSTVSVGVRRSLQLLAHFYGMPPWSPALKLKVEAVKARSGFTTFILSPTL